MNTTTTISRTGLKIATPCRYPHYTPVQKLIRKANTGDAEAQFELARRYDTGNGVKKSYSEAAKWYRMAAERGHEKAQHCLSSCYAFGWGVEKDENASIHWRAMEEITRYNKDPMTAGDWLLALFLIVFGIPAAVLYILWKAIDFLSLFVGPVLLCKAVYRHYSR